MGCLKLFYEEPRKVLEPSPLFLLKGLGKNYSEPKKCLSSSTYGFNGKEDDRETGYQDYGMRQYNTRLGRFFSVDPLTSKYPELTPYQFASNTPIWGIDLDGEEVRIYTESAQYYKGNVGHTFLTVGSGDDIVVYTYGRYDDLAKDKRSANFTNINGEGVLIRLTGEKARKFISKYVHDYGAKVFELTDITKEEEAKVKTHFDNIFNSSDKLPDREGGAYENDPDARVVDVYDIFGNNCTTTSCEGAVEGGTTAFDYNESTVPSNPYNPTGGYTKNKYELWTPSGLQGYLGDQAKKENSVVKDVTNETKEQNPKQNGATGTW